MNTSTAINFRDRPGLIRVLPFAIFMAFIVCGALWNHLPDYGTIPRWYYALRVVTVAFVLVAFWKRYSELRSFAGITWRSVLAAIVGGIGVFILWINLDLSWATFGHAQPFDPSRDDGGIDWAVLQFRMIGLALVVPVMEELFWRSFMMRWIDRQNFLELSPGQISLRAILISSLLFASEHRLWLAGIIAGLVYGWLYVRFRNLWVPIISHAVTNAALGVWVITTGNWQFL